MPTPVDDEAKARLLREIDHHRRIAPAAERFWSWASPSGARRATRRAALFVELGGLAPGRRALEFGCGTGVFLEKVAASGVTLHGVDLSQELLEQAAERTRKMPNVHLHRGNAEHLPFADGTFDAVYGSSILHHLNLVPALQEVFRVLKAGGKFVFAEPNALNPQIAFIFHFDYAKPYLGVSPDEMAFSRFHARRTLAAVGFSGIDVRPFDFLHPSIPAAFLDRAQGVAQGLEKVPLLREIAGSLLIQGQRPVRVADGRSLA
jgi:SAM-dependent methyltransferase